MDDEGRIRGGGGGGREDTDEEDEDNTDKLVCHITAIIPTLHI